MKRQRERLLVFEIDNCQRDYSFCLQIIRMCNGKEEASIGSISEIEPFLRDNKLFLSETVQTGSLHWLEEPICKRGQSIEDAKAVFFDSIHRRIVLGKAEFVSLLQSLSSKTIALHYHIRVRSGWHDAKEQSNQLSSLQYLALLLRKFEADGFFKRNTKKEVSVFLNPGDINNYPFKSNNSTDGINEFQDIASQYLRMIAKKYTGVIFCAYVSNGDEVHVRALDLKESLRVEQYFPIIPINANMYERLFSETKPVEFYEKLLRAKKSFGFSSNPKPEMAIPDFVLLAGMSRIKRVVGDPMQRVLPIIRESGGASVLEFCFFAFLLSKEDEAKSIWALAEEIEGGIRQIVQNAVQYSQYKECMFSFYLRDCEPANSMLGEPFPDRYPGFMLSVDNNSGRTALEVLVSDLNDQSDMLKSFSKNLEYDSEIFPSETYESFCGHYALLDNSDQIYIRNFFSEFEEADMKDAWRDFREKDIVSHIGLSLLALTADRCGATICVTSCDNYQPDDRNRFYKVFGNDDKVDRINQENRILPGTQFSMLIPVGKTSHSREYSIGQIEVQEYIREDYSTFAKYIDYREKTVLISKNEVGCILKEMDSQQGGISERKEKNNAILRWFHFWETFLTRECVFNEKLVYRCDMAEIMLDDYFRNRDTAEVCIKGFMVALSRLEGMEYPVHIALDNLPDGFINLFCGIASLIGVRNISGKIQLYLHEKNEGEDNTRRELIFAGANFAQSICRSYILSLEHGTNGCSFSDYKKAIELYEKLMPDAHCLWENGENYAMVCPFDSILRAGGNTRTTLFEKKIHDMAERELDGRSKGYKLSETHMRLGSKVHIESFYEMSFLFYRTSIANRIAFLILRDLIEEEESDFDIVKDPVMFFGYASYSKAILTSLSEILRIYRYEQGVEESDRLVSIASYQHNLQSDSNNIQMYFELDDAAVGNVTEDNKLELKAPVNIVQVVPISSTLTTFAKMWNEFTSHIQTLNQTGCAILRRNYTLFWVVDSTNKQKAAMRPSTIESKYWLEVKGKKIVTRLRNLAQGGCGNIRYFICSPVVWHNPLQCKLCFPENVSEEIPLVETDATSTVPALQIRYMTDEHVRNESSDEFAKSLSRLIKLKGCIRQGHIVRRRNHFQYYIDTQKYFRIAREDIARWLLEEIPRRKEEKQKEFPALHIIFSPEHNTNVGFAQYVNTYYFSGLAEIVSVNVDKEFRSNFVCEHAALMNMIASLHRLDSERKGIRIHFYFVDDSITSGETFEKANSLLHSLIPAEVKHRYPSNLFEKIFLLVDRLSMDTRRMYVENMEENFHSFVHIDVSNMRTQGDSCVGCKLRKDAERMFKRSATRRQAEYWAGKLVNYRQISFDDLKELKKIDAEESYRSMMVYHMLQNVVIKDGRAYTVGEAYDTLLDILEWFVSDGHEGSLHGYQVLFSKMDNMSCIRSVLDIICRPFFSYDYKIKLQVLTFYIFTTEQLLGVPADYIFSESKPAMSSKAFMFSNCRKSRTQNLVERIKNTFPSQSKENEFLENCLIEGLAEMGSTYLMRKDTMKKAYSYIVSNSTLSENEKNEFWEKYAECIHRILSNTRDETKEHWLEYLFTTGEEYSKEKAPVLSTTLIRTTGFPALYTAVTGKTEDVDDEYGFRRFVLELFLQNTGVKFVGAGKLANAVNSNASSNANKKPGNLQPEASGNRGADISDEYFMDSWNEMRKMEQMATGNRLQGKAVPVDSRFYLFVKKKKKTGSKEGDKVTDWYRKFLNLVADEAELNYGLAAKTTRRFLITDNSPHNRERSWIPELNIISEQMGADNREKQVDRYLAKLRLEQALRDRNGQKSSLEEYGYYLCDNVRENYFILFFDNPEGNEKLVKQGYNLARVFLYMSFQNSTGAPLGIRYVMRDILMYRYRILSVLGQDFNGDTFSNYAKSNDERNILSHEKAASHSASTDDAISTELFVYDKIKLINDEKVYQTLRDNKEAHYDKAYWLLIRNYTNNQIARLFNRSFRNDESGEIPPLYPESSFSNRRKGVFGQKLQYFADLNLTDTDGTQDKRFEILGKAMDIVVEIEEKDEFVYDARNRYYNLEYFRCILIDSMLSAIKYQAAEGDDYLVRVDDLLKWKSYSRGDHAKIRIYRGNTDNSGVDYLMIENSVNRWACCLSNYEEKNQEIQMKLKDPLDFIDGHMSMLTTKRYVENLGVTDTECRFYYEKRENMDGKEQIYFLSCLPVLKGKG